MSRPGTAESNYSIRPQSNISIGSKISEISSKSISTAKDIPILSLPIQSKKYC